MNKVRCARCGDIFTTADLNELREMGEAYYIEKGCFLCPDCWDVFQRMSLEEQAQAAIMGIGETEKYDKEDLKWNAK